MQNLKGGQYFQGSLDGHLKCDLWSVGVLCAYLFLGQTVFHFSNYATLFQDVQQSDDSDRPRKRGISNTQNGESRSLLSRAVQAVTTATSNLGPFLAAVSNRGVPTSCQASSSDVTQEAEVSEWEDCFMEAAVKDQVQVLVEQQLAILSQRGVSPDLLVLMQGLLDPDHDRRLAVSDALASPVFRRFIRNDVAHHPRECTQSTCPFDSGLSAPGLQLWGVLRQRRPQLSEMARRETLVATLAGRRDALDRLADLVYSTLAGEATHADIDNTPGWIGQVAQQDAARGNGVAVKRESSKGK